MMPASGLDTEAKRSLTEWIYRKNERNFADLCEKTCICPKIYDGKVWAIRQDPNYLIGRFQK